jgi:molybdate transport system substrate-binding protein
VKKILILATSAVLLLAACSDSNDDGGTTGTTGASGGSGGAEAELTVSAASSLTEAFGEIGDAFEAANPGTTVTFNFGPSDGLAGQIDQGAPVDVFASASPTWMDSVQDDGPGVTDRADFAQNRLAIIVPADNPAGIEDLNDLTEDGVQLVIAAEGVPAGDYAREIFKNAGISKAAMANVVSNEEDVKAVITKVMSGEADAGIGYVTDVTPDVADEVTLIPIPDEVNVIATYPIAVVNGSEEADLAQGFVEYVLGDGQQTLAEYGFLPPP